jgi:hypothetical protein
VLGEDGGVYEFRCPNVSKKGKYMYVAFLHENVIMIFFYHVFVSNSFGLLISHH